MIKYVCEGGYIKSQYDGSIHYITSRIVAKLYGVLENECIFIIGDDKCRDFCRDKYINLFPRSDGKYNLESEDGGE